MGIPKKRTSKMRRDRRRAANNNLRSAVQLNRCPKCGAALVSHRVCAVCGYYGDKKVLTVDNN